MAKAKQPSKKTEDNQASARKIAKVMTAAKIVEIRRTALTFADYNPRQMKSENFRKLCDSIRRFGLVDPPVVNQRSVDRGWPEGESPTVVGGHQRLRAADKVIGSQDYPVKVSMIDVDANVEKALNVALNNAMLMAQFDQAMLEKVLMDMAASDYSPENAGFTKTELNFLISDASFSQIFGDQEEEESGYIDGLLAMKQAEKESRTKKEKGESDGVQVQGEGNEEDGEWNEEEYEPEENEENEEVDLDQLVKNDLKKKRTDYQRSREELDAADVMLTVCFDNPIQLRRFLASNRLNDTRYFDVAEIVHAFGLKFDLEDPSE